MCKRFGENRFKLISKIDQGQAIIHVFVQNVKFHCILKLLIKNSLIFCNSDLDLRPTNHMSCHKRGPFILY